MRSVNEVFLLGNVGQDPEVRETSGGMRIAKVSLATSRKYKDQEQTQWHRLTLFGALAEVAEKYVRKGDRIHVRGRIEYSTTEHEGTTRYWTDIVVNDLVMLGSTSGATSEPAKDPLPF